MAFDRNSLIRCCKQHGTVARVVVVRTRGSAPREVGASMLVWRKGFSGTIGGGALEFSAMNTARQMDRPGSRKMTRHALGPDMGQCCGGSVDLLTEVYDLASAEALPEDVIARGEGDMPLPVARLVAQMRSDSAPLRSTCVGDWMIEPVSPPQRHIWIWGAGHVGRALVDVLVPLGLFEVTWIDVDTARFPDHVPEGVETIAAAHPEKLVRYAPQQAEHLIVTYSHDLDLELCHRLLGHGFAHAGLIGSATKWARFRSRLAALGHDEASVRRITCPIGRPELGKHPHAIALGVATEMLAQAPDTTLMEGIA